MGNYRVISNRVLKNKKGEETGRLAVRVPNDSNTAEGFLVCPECRQRSEVKQEWTKPFVVVCSQCGNKIKMMKLKDEAKKEDKKLRAKEREEFLKNFQGSNES